MANNFDMKGTRGIGIECYEWQTPLTHEGTRGNGIKCFELSWHITFHMIVCTPRMAWWSVMLTYEQEKDALVAIRQPKYLNKVDLYRFGNSQDTL